MTTPVFSHSPQRALTQKEVLQRIAAQRQKLEASQSVSGRLTTVHAQSSSDTALRQQPPLWAQLVGFVIDHPVAAACITAGAVLVGPRRLIKWSGIVLPWVLTQQR